MGLFWMLLMQLCPQLFLYAFMSPTPQVAVMAPGILRAYGLSYLLLPFNIFATYYFQAMMKPQLSTVASLARGVVISGGMILLLPLLLGANSLWYTMLITEMLVTVYSVYHTIRCTKKLI